MSKMGKFLASKKKAGVKASLDSTLQAALTSTTVDTDAVPEDSLKSSAAKTLTTDDWGVDSDNEAVNGQSVSVGGGHFHLITEEDVSRKQQRKPRKWGEVTQDKPEEKVEAVEGEAVEQIAEKPKSEEPVKVELYKAKRGALAHKPLDVSNPAAYPSLSFSLNEPASSTGAAALKKKEKKADVAEKGAKVEEQETNSADAGTQDATSTEKDEGTLMLIEEFLRDIVKPQVNVVYDDDASKSKFVGRKKPRFNGISGSRNQ